jgi:hypothetical protein
MTDDNLTAILEEENIAPNAKVSEMCALISSRHLGRVQAFLYYGSSLRDMNSGGKMLDFYVVVDSYRKTHKNPVRALLNTAIPPAVYYIEIEHEDGSLSSCKYSIISLKAFERRCGASALLSTVWGRFSQPSILLHPVNDAVKTRIMHARAKAVRHLAHETAPLFSGRISPVNFWARALRESYRTELRPEASETRSVEIVERYKARYTALSNELFGAETDEAQAHEFAPSRNGAVRFRWLLRRIIGKPMTAVRVLNNAATFDGGLDYVLRKLKNHSGVTIEVTKSQRKHPILWSPILGWKLWRKGAFR